MREHTFETIPTLQIRHNCLLIYETPVYNSFGRKLASLNSSQTSIQHPSFNNSIAQNKSTYSGDMTRGSIQRLKKAINTLVSIAEWKEATHFKSGKVFKWKLNFITLTLPAPQGTISDKELKKTCLDPFLKRARRKYGLKHYIWKAETQKNGNLHFHLTTDCFIHYEKLRNDWNQCLLPTGLIDKFEQKHGHRCPNSTDVHATYAIKNLVSYFIKYFTKDNKDGARVEGKMWDCSQSLKQKDKCTTVIDSETNDFLDNIIKRYPAQVKRNDYCTFIFLRGKQFDQVIKGRYLELWNEWRQRIRDYEPPERRSKVPLPEIRQPLVKIKSPDQLRLEIKNLFTSISSKKRKGNR